MITEVFCYGVLPRDPTRVEDPAARDFILVRLALEELLSLLDRFMDLLSAYWEVAFQVEWQRLKEQERLGTIYGSTIRSSKH